jgi:hypothetical protein
VRDIYLEKDEITPWISRMKENGVTRVLFHSKKGCGAGRHRIVQKVGLDTAVACPMMLLGKGLHKFHKFLAGV